MKFTNISKKNKARLIFYPCFLMAVTASVFWMKWMPGESYQGKMPELTKQQLQQKEVYLNQLNEFAKTPHNFMYPKELEKTKNFLIKELELYGYEVNKQEYGQQKFTNLEVIIKADKESKGTIVIGAHYDSETDTPGANDNGSGVVMLLDLAKRLKDLKTDYELRIVFFVNEEPPFFRQPDMGSTVYVDDLIKKQVNIKAAYIFDTVGYYFEEEGTQHYPLLFAPFFPDKANFVAFVSGLASRDLLKETVKTFREDAKIASEGVSAPTYIQGIDFSDHLSFYKYNIPALMITDTAFFRSKTYHQVTDTPEKLNYEKMVLVTDGLEKTFKKLYGK